MKSKLILPEIFYTQLLVTALETDKEIPLVKVHLWYSSWKIEGSADAFVVLYYTTRGSTAEASIKFRKS